MGGIRKGRFKFIFCFLAGITSGTILGCILISTLVSYRMDLFHEKIAYLENIIEDRNEKLEKLKNSVNNYNFVIKDIEIITLNFDGDEFDNIKVKKVIKEKYNSLLGKKVKDIDADILIQVIDKRILSINDKEYKLNVKKLILTEVLKIWVTIEKVE